MQTFSGVGVAPGRVLGPVRQMPKPVQEPAAPLHQPVNIPADVTVESQAARVKDAAKAVQAELRNRAATAAGEGKEVLEATALMAADPMLIKSAIKLLNPEAPGGARTAERAVWEAAATGA
jgi:phosphotransferase system enzyme I (PtsI)